VFFDRSYTVAKQLPTLTIITLAKYLEINQWAHILTVYFSFDISTSEKPISKSGVLHITHCKHKQAGCH
jgi:hypothetical protein